MSLQEQISELETKLILRHYHQKGPLDPLYMAKIQAEAQGLSDKAYLSRLQEILKEGG